MRKVILLGAVLAVVLLPGCRGTSSYQTLVSVTYQTGNGTVSITHAIGGAR